MIHKCDRSDFVLSSLLEKVSHERNSQRSKTTTGKMVTTLFFFLKNNLKKKGKKKKTQASKSYFKAQN